MNRKHIQFLLPLGVASVLVAPACEETDRAADLDGDIAPRSGPAASDAGDASFVRQAVPVMLGRKVRGHAELDFMLDVVAQTSRTQLLRALADHDESHDHWTEFYVDRLRVARTGDKAMTSCYGPAIRGDDDGALARIVETRDAASGPIAGVGAYNMTDLARSAIEADDVSTMYRAHLFPLVTHNIVGANEVDEVMLRAEANTLFTTAYHNRQYDCVGCHGSLVSLSGAGSGWNRMYPLPGRADLELFRDGSNWTDPRDTASFFRSDVTGTTNHPWGLAPGCGEFDAPGAAPDDPEGFTAFLGHDFGDNANVWDLEGLFYDGIERLRRFGVNRIGGIVSFHEEDALAYLVAANIADQVWSEVMGSPLTIAHSFARTEAQRDLHASLTERPFLVSDWSNQQLLVRILTSPYFNRLPPDTATGTSAYDLPLVFDPWVAHDPRENQEPSVEQQHNAMTDAVHRYSARSLLSSVHSAVGWPAPKRFPHAVDYPDVDLARSLGAFLRDAEPGFAGSDFQGLLAWDHEVATGEPPDGVMADDWVDRALAAAAPFDASHPSARLTLEDLVVSTKDWFVADGTIRATPTTDRATSERADLEAYFGVPLSTYVSKIPSGELETKLRAYVGVLMQSPQFVLAGIAPTQVGPQPRLRVCNDGACTYEDICREFAPLLESARVDVTCGADFVEIEPVAPSPNLDFAEQFCRPDLCEFERLDVLAACFSDPAMCPRQPPGCDPRCSDLGCCGMDMPIEDDLGMFLLWADGATVTSVSNARILAVGSDSWKPLAKHRQVKTGDLIELAEGASLVMQVGDEQVATPFVAPKNSGTGSWLVQITGADALGVGVAPMQDDPNADIAGYLKSAWMFWGSGGPPLP